MTNCSTIFAVFTSIWNTIVYGKNWHKSEQRNHREVWFWRKLISLIKFAGGNCEQRICWVHEQNQRFKFQIDESIVNYELQKLICG